MQEVKGIKKAYDTIRSRVQYWRGMKLRTCLAPYLYGLLLPSHLLAVTHLAVGDLLEHKSNYFDLEHKQIHFQPVRPSGYKTTTKRFGTVTDHGSAIKPGPQRLPFHFSFAGKEWGEVHVNVNGNLTFGAPDHAEFPERESWPNGTMRWMASALDTESIAGRRWMIAPFWGLNSAETTRIWVKSSPAEWTATWDATRYQATNEGYAPLGHSVYQVRLGQDGSIDFRYDTVAEKDGIVGIFGGAALAGKHLDAVELQDSDIRHAAVDDMGANLHISIALTKPIPERTDSGTISYRAFAYGEDDGFAMLFDVNAKGRSSRTICYFPEAVDNGTPNDCPTQAIVLAKGNVVDVYVPKIGLKNPRAFSWKVEVTRSDGSSAVSAKSRKVRLANSMEFGFDLSTKLRPAKGSVYEVFHYPHVAKSRSTALRSIYKRVSNPDELVIVFADFRIDDIHDHGASNRIAENPSASKKIFGSSSVQNAAGPIYLGPRFSEAMRDGGRTFKNYAFGVGWMAHEMTHRWAAHLRWNGPNAGALLETACQCHWTDLLNTPAVNPVSSIFANSPYPEESQMGGMVVEKLPDGSMESRKSPWGAATGLSALDLYAMGLIGPEEVPDTFFISPEGGGTMVPVRIADIIAANGPQTPAAKDSQHQFKLGIYLLHEDGRQPYPEKLAQARGLESALIRYFSMATGGRMTVTPTKLQ